MVFGCGFTYFSVFFLLFHNNFGEFKNFSPESQSNLYEIGAHHCCKNYLTGSM